MFHRLAIIVALASCLIAVAADIAAAPPAKKDKGEPLFVAVGYGGRRISSNDGRHWQHDIEWAARGGDDDNVLFNIAYGKGRFVAVGGAGTGRIAVTTDGKTWRELPQRKLRVSTIAFGNDRFVAGHTNHFLYSTDGEDWREGEAIDFKGGILMRNSAFGNGVFVVIGDADRWKTKDETENPKRVSFRASTKDGQKIASFEYDTPPARAIAFGAGRFVVVGPDGLRQSSTDGKTWGHTANAAGETLDSVIHDGKQFLATGGGFAYTSPDGKTWTKLPGGAPCSVLYGDGRLYIGAAWGGSLWHSTDGKTWRKADIPPGNAFEAVAAGRLSK